MTKLEQVRAGKAVLKSSVCMFDILKIIQLGKQHLSVGKYYWLNVPSNEWRSSYFTYPDLPIVLASEVLKEMESDILTPKHKKICVKPDCLCDGKCDVTHKKDPPSKQEVLKEMGESVSADGKDYAFIRHGESHAPMDMSKAVVAEEGYDEVEVGDEVKLYVASKIAEMKQEIMEEIMEELREEDLDFSKPLNKAIDAVIENYKEAGLVVTRDDFEVVKKGDGFDFRRKEEPTALANSGENEKPKFKVGDVVYHSNEKRVYEMKGYSSDGLSYWLEAKDGSSAFPVISSGIAIKPTPQQKAEFFCPYEKGEMCAVWDEHNMTIGAFDRITNCRDYVFTDIHSNKGDVFRWKHHVSLTDPELLNKLPKD